MRFVAIALVAGCWTSSPPPAAVVPAAPAGPPVLDQPPWPKGDKLVVRWSVATEHGTTEDAAVDFVLGGVNRHFVLGRPGAHVWPAHQSVCDRRLGTDETLPQLESDGDFAQLVFTDDDANVTATFRVRRPRPELLELVRMRPRRVIATVPIPAHVTLDEWIEDIDGTRSEYTYQTFGCGLDEGMSP